MTEGARPIRFLFLVLPASLPFYLLDFLAPAQALAVTAPLIAVVIAMRIAIGIVYARGRQSLPQAVIIHGMYNLCAMRLFSNSGSSYDPLSFAAALWLDLAIYFFSIA